ncbi:MAG: hypothetical protein LRY40_08805 [Shewanella fodinae]|nr:hypothetical protein [Shewanella fodinae]
MAIDLIAQTGLSSLPVIYYLEQLFRLIFICPCCANKRLYLYAASNGWACRECLGLHYACQSEAPMDRLAVRLESAGVSYGEKQAEPSLFEDSFPIKPKGKHQRSFAQEYQKLVRAESAYNVFFIKKLKAMGVAIPLI